MYSRAHCHSPEGHKLGLKALLVHSIAWSDSGVLAIHVTELNGVGRVIDQSISEDTRGALETTEDELLTQGIQASEPMLDGVWRGCQGMTG